MTVARKIDKAMKTILIRELEEFAPRHGNHLLGSSKTAIVSHNSAHQAGAQEHVGALNENNLSTLLRGRDRSCTT
jgi:hypothetical protein